MLEGSQSQEWTGEVVLAMEVGATRLNEREGKYMMLDPTSEEI